MHRTSASGPPARRRRSKVYFSVTTDNARQKDIAFPFKVMNPLIADRAGIRVGSLLVLLSQKVAGCWRCNSCTDGDSDPNWRVAINLRSSDATKSRFSAYVEGLIGVIGHADRNGPLRDYCVGLMLPCERKSVEPLAARTAPARTSAQHQKLLHFVGVAAWSDEKVLAKAREMVLPAIERHGPIEAWIIDDTGFPKKGAHSVGVARQYCGQQGKQDNCQVAVSLSLANRHASLPVAYRLYLPENWAETANSAQGGRA